MKFKTTGRARHETLIYVWQEEVPDRSDWPKSGTAETSDFIEGDGHHIKRDGQAGNSPRSLQPGIPKGIYDGTSPGREAPEMRTCDTTVAALVWTPGRSAALVPHDKAYLYEFTHSSLGVCQEVRKAGLETRITRALAELIALLVRDNIPIDQVDRIADQLIEVQIARDRYENKT